MRLAVTLASFALALAGAPAPPAKETLEAINDLAVRAACRIIGSRHGKKGFRKITVRGHPRGRRQLPVDKPEHREVSCGTDDMIGLAAFVCERVR